MSPLYRPLHELNKYKIYNSSSTCKSLFTLSLQSYSDSMYVCLQVLLVHTGSLCPILLTLC